MTNKDFQIGSTWRKWDLHIHTPISMCSEYGGQTEEIWQKFFEKLEELSKDIKVIGINDYLFLDGYKEVLKYKQNGGLKDIELILPVIEFRLKEFVGHEKLKRLNYHIIFADEATLNYQLIETQFLAGFKGKASLNAEVPSDITWGGVVTKETLIELGEKIYNSIPPDKKPQKKNYLEIGFNNINFEISKIEELLGEKGEHNSYLNNKYFKAIGKTEWESFSWESGILDKKNIINTTHFIFAASPTVEGVISAKKKLKQQDVNSRVLHCSDAHMFPIFSEIKTKTKDKELGHCFTWIKADPTFEGLRQLLFEPEERINLSETNPELDFDKPVFTSIVISTDTKILNSEKSNLSFEEKVIPLNRNLVSIIGGRGQGKSMLINYLANSFGKEIDDKLATKLTASENMVAKWKQSFDSNEKDYPLNEKKELPFTFIYQSKIKEIADDPDKLKEEVIEILKGAGYKSPIPKYDEIQVKEKFQNYWNIKDWLNKKDVTGDFLLNDANRVQQRIDAIKENIELATDRSNKELLETFITNLYQIQENSNAVETLRLLKQDLLSLKTNFNLRFSRFRITEISTERQDLEIDALILANTQSNIELKAQNEKIRTENFKNFKGDLSQLLNNLENDRNEISMLEKEILNIKEKEADLLKAKDELNKILKGFYESLLIEAQLINDIWQNNIFNNPSRNEKENELIKNILANRGIKIESEIFFNKSLFVVSAERLIDGRVVKSKRDKVLEILQIGENIVQDILDFTIEKLEEINAKNKGTFWEGIDGDIANIFFNQEIRNKYLFVRPKITVNAKELDELSAGQKGTIYLCLKLATQLFSGPLIFDQPEDDLDNEFINNELISLFLEIKSFRQVIIVSHNANLVVNADSEQIIIAHNNNELLRYECGSLENSIINQGICKILEGGKAAFEKRRSKYQEIK